MQNLLLETLKIIEEIKQTKIKRSLLLHVCCAPCSSSVIEYLSSFFDITLYFFNPNITDREEYDLRIAELKRFIKELPEAKDVSLIEGEYNPQEFFNLTKNFAKDKEGGKRCELCYKLRLFSTAKMAKERGFDLFTTTLSVSPYKNADKLNEIGDAASKMYDTAYLFSDFKKKNGYKRSIELSKQYDLYRQDFCGCIYSKQESQERRSTKT